METLTREAATSPRPASHFYRALGFDLSSDTELQDLEPGRRESLSVELRFDRSPGDVVHCGPVIDGLLRDSAGAPHFRLSLASGHAVLAVNRVGWFEISPRRVSVRTQHDSPRNWEALKQLVPTALALLHEIHVGPVLHATAVVRHGQAILLMADCGQGKSTAAAALVRQGFSLLSDDLVGLRPLGSGWAACGVGLGHRLTERSTAALGVATRGRRLSAAGKFQVTLSEKAQGPVPVRAVYLYGRRDHESATWAEVTALGPARAMAELIRHSYLGVLALPASGNRRLAALGQLAATQCVRQLTVANSFLSLESLGRAVEHDVTPGAGGTSVAHFGG